GGGGGGGIVRAPAARPGRSRTRRGRLLPHGPMNQPGGAAAPQADGASAAGRKSTASRERLKRSQKSSKVEGPEAVPAEASLSAEQGTMTEVKVKTELPDDYIQEVIWQGEAKEEKKAVGKDGTSDVPAEICVVIGGVRNQQTLGSYECGICGKKYKYYNCFQTHVRAHRDTEATSGEGASQSNNFRYTCDICGKKYKYYSCFQEHRDLHAVDAESAFSRRVEGKAQNHFEETNSSSQNSSEPYTCGACGIQFQFYNNLLEHMQSHAADNENNIASNQSRSPPAVVEEKWKPQVQRNSANNRVLNSGDGQKEAQGEEVTFVCDQKAPVCARIRTRTHLSTISAGCFFLT
ncbi:hypothetical protein H8959_021904, partial [Pygathrix nigripes]